LGYDVLGYTIEQVSGLSFEDYIKKNILLPASMTESDFRFFEITDSLKTFAIQKIGFQKTFIKVISIPIQASMHPAVHSIRRQKNFHNG